MDELVGTTGVKFCKKSTITEAWTYFSGLPAVVDDTEAPVLRRAARNEIPQLEDKAAIVSVDVESGPVAPYWNKQVTWLQDRYLARFGHRYLSVHFVRQHDEPYAGFDRTLKPWINRWLAIYQEALGQAAFAHPVDKVGFGYVNTFLFDSTDFDLSRFFKLNFAVDIGTPDAGLIDVGIKFDFFDSKREVRLLIDLRAEGPTVEVPDIRVVTKIFAEKRGLERLSFGDQQILLDEVFATKLAARDTFFRFTTDRTHEFMEMVSDG